MSNTHFTANVKVNKTVNTAATKEYQTVIPAKRDVTDIADFTIRADTLEELVAKVNAHVSLVAPVVPVDVVAQ